MLNSILKWLKNKSLEMTKETAKELYDAEYRHQKYRKAIRRLCLFFLIFFGILILILSNL